MWVKQYKKKRSNARDIIRNKERRENMAKKRDQKKEKQKEKTVKEDTSKKKSEDIRISAEKYFMLCNGTPIRSIKELAFMLDKISDDDFSYHVTDEKNDFSNWIRDVFGKERLAESLGRLKNKKESQIYLLKHALSEEAMKKDRNSRGGY